MSSLHWKSIATSALVGCALVVATAAPGAAQLKKHRIDYDFDEVKVDSAFEFIGSVSSIMEYDCSMGPLCGTYAPMFISTYFYEDFLGYGRQVTNVTGDSASSVGWSIDSTMNNQQGFCQVDAFNDYFVQTRNYLHVVNDGSGWNQYPGDYPKCGYHVWARPRTGTVEWAGKNGVFAITTEGKLIRKHWTGSWTTTHIPHWGGDLVVGSLIQGEGTGASGNVYGVNENGQMFTTWISGGVPTFALIPGAVNLDPHSLALSNGNGVFGVRTTGELVRSYWAGTGWATQVIPHWGGGLVPSSLVQGDGSGLTANIYGVNENGQVFTVYYTGTGLSFALITESSNIHPDSIVFTDGNGVFGIDTAGALKHIYWSAGSWHADTIPHWGPALNPVSLIAGKLTGPSANVYGVNASGQMFTTWLSSGVVTFAIVPGTSGLDPESLAPTDGNGVFGVRTSGELVRSYWGGGGWNTDVIPHWGAAIVPESLIDGELTGTDANVYAVNTAGQLVGTWNDSGTITYAIIP